MKYLAKTFTLPDVQVGGIIEYYYTYNYRERYIFDSHWILSEEIVHQICQVLAEELTIPPYAK